MSYHITRIRLVNFHNFVDETIDIPDGGHLFLMGGNGSGKTTVLDAVHYVLTAGEDMELNAAARVAGARSSGGRRLQGLIMRLNVETGPLNPHGGITYAALQLGGRAEPVTIGIGMRTAAMDEPVRRWGFVCPGKSLEDIPFLQTDMTGRRPSTQAELKTALGSHYYGNIGGYISDITRRYFDGPDRFAEVCRILRMGKAYREIVASSRDYHELFRRLLPEPKTDVFERVIEALRTLDASKSELSGIEERLGYLRKLGELVDEIQDCRDSQLLFDWLGHHLQLTAFDQRESQLATQRKKRDQGLDSAGQEIEETSQTREQIQARLDDLKTRDGSNLLRQEKEVADQLARRESERAEQDAYLNSARDGLRSSQDTLHEGRDGLRSELHAIRLGLADVASPLPFATTALAAALEAAEREPRSEIALATLPLPEMSQGMLAARDQLTGDTTLLEREISDLQATIAERETELHAFHNQSEAAPDVPGLARARAALRKALIDHRCLYEELEWADGLGQSQMDVIEALIGGPTLATIRIATSDHEAAEPIIFAESALRLAHPVKSELPEWIRQSFDVARSEPEALRTLAAEMISEYGPDFEDVLRFRGHLRRMPDQSASFIGLESRRRALGAKVVALEVALAALKNALVERQEALENLAAARQRLDQFDGLLNRCHAAVRAGHELRSSQQQVEHQLADIATREETLAKLHIEMDHIGQRLRDIRGVIQKEELSELESKMVQLRNQLGQLEAHSASLLKRQGQLENQLEDIDRQLAELCELRSDTSREIAESAAHVRERFPSAVDVEPFVAASSACVGIDDPATLAQEMQASAEREQRSLAVLQERIRDPLKSAAHAFHYEPATNRLVGRGGADIARIVTKQQGSLAEQKDIINEHTIHFFRDIVMHDLVQFFKRHIHELDAMIKKINVLLAGRSFGGNRYSFSRTEVDRYKRLVQIIRKFNLLDDEAGKELREFFEDHREEIIDSDREIVPDVLDYRNWFRFDMKVMAVNDKEVLMDRRTKSIGSGGEQAVPNYLLILTVAHFLYAGNELKIQALVFDEAFYGIDAERRNQLLGFATDLGLQLFVASPDQDGVKEELAHSTTIFVIKDKDFNVHLRPFHYVNPDRVNPELLAEFAKPVTTMVAFGDEL
jgi:recombinational DNA repair ATPase RecF